MGMFKGSIDDDPVIARNLIIGKYLANIYLSYLFVILYCFIELRPETALKLLPGLPAYILFMCIRYYDFTKEEKRVSSLIKYL